MLFKIIVTSDAKRVLKFDTYLILKYLYYLYLWFFCYKIFARYFTSKELQETLKLLKKYPTIEIDILNIKNCKGEDILKENLDIWVFKHKSLLFLKHLS